MPSATSASRSAASRDARNGRISAPGAPCGMATPIDGACQPRRRTAPRPEHRTPWRNFAQIQSRKLREDAREVYARPRLTTSSLIAREILDQPRAWARAADLARAEEGVLPRGERVAVLGCGSSWHAAKVLASLRELGGHGETDAFAASEALLGRRYDRVVAISRSGATTEIRRALEQVAPGTATVALVGDPDSPVAAQCDRV